MAGSVSYKCPSCGAPLEYSPGQEQVTCEYCGTGFEIKTLESLYHKEQDMAAQSAAAKEALWHTEQAGSQWSEEERQLLRAFTCSSCGAEIVCDENTMATECCYCGNPAMLPTRFAGMLRPDYVLPFKKTKEEAVAALKEFYKGKYLLPGSFMADNRVEAIQGMYVPFWLFDAEIEATASFKAENDLLQRTHDADIIETLHYDCQRRGRMRFERIPCDGSKKMDDAYMESIEPFDYTELTPFTTAYLAGFLADKYDVAADECIGRADQRVTASAEGVLRSTVSGYMRVALADSACVKHGGSVRYAMAPVWILTTRYKDKLHTFMMNGQTGKVAGSLPIDGMKAFLYPAALFAVLWPVIYLLLTHL